MSDLGPGPRRRAAIAPRERVRRPSPTALAAIVLCAVTLVAAVLAGGGRGPVAAPPSEPDQRPLTHAVRACPSGAGSPTLALTRTSSPAGEVNIGDAVEAVAPGARTSIERAEATVVRAEGGSAPGLLATRLGGPGLRALACEVPRATTWFTGVAGDAVHSSVIELINPDDGPAVVDVLLHGTDGPVDAPGLRGVAVPGQGETTLDLAALVPRRDELAAQVLVTRGRVVSSVLDRLRPIGSGAASSEWLPGQEQPARVNTLLGLVPGPGRRQLVIANPGADQVRVDLRVLTTDSIYAPAGVEDLTVPAGSTLRVPLTATIRAGLADGAVGLVLGSSAPVTAALSRTAGSDRAMTVPSEAVRSASLLLPTGESRVVMVPQGHTVTVALTVWDTAGAELVNDRIELNADTGTSYDVPPGASLVRVEAEQGGLRGAVLTTQGPAAAPTAAVVQPLRPEVTENLVPHVRPGPTSILGR